MPYQLPKLPFAFDALEPHISAQTMEVHYTKHHQAYCDKTNAALKGTEWAQKPIEEVLANLDKLPEEMRTAVRNNGGGFANHSLFWTLLTPEKTAPAGELEKALSETFGSAQDFKTKFSEAATGLFGSGWAWLTYDARAGLQIAALPNQDSPVSDGKTPILALDVWEHAYYLDRQNRRPEYVAAFWEVVNWDEVAKRLSNAQR